MGDKVERALNDLAKREIERLNRKGLSTDWQVPPKMEDIGRAFNVPVVEKNGDST